MEYDYTKIKLSDDTAKAIFRKSKSSDPRSYNSNLNADYDFRENSNSSSGNNYSLKAQPGLIKSMSVCNTHTSAITFDLYSNYYIHNIYGNVDPSYDSFVADDVRAVTDPNTSGRVRTDDETQDNSYTDEKCYLLKTVTIPSGTTLLLDFDNDICYNHKEADLYVQLGHSSYNADIIIKKYKTTRQGY